jgi:hypothetical protein
MTIQELFIRSNQALQVVIAQIGEDQWSLPMSLGTSTKPSSLLEAVRYHAYDDAWVPDVLAGRTIAEVGEEYQFILGAEGAATPELYAKYNARACEASRDFSQLENIVHLSYGDYPAREYLQHIISFRAFRIYDIAKLIGADTVLPDDLVQALWDEFIPVVEGYRAMGVFPPAIPVPEDANLQTKLLALVGRE